jgi:hypothetical protein
MREARADMPEPIPALTTTLKMRNQAVDGLNRSTLRGPNAA